MQKIGWNVVGGKSVQQIGSIINGKQNRAADANTIEVRNPYNGELLATIACATKENVLAAVDGAQAVFEREMRQMAAHERSKILRNASLLLEERSERFAHCISAEAGKPIVEARAEVMRAVQVLLFASEEAKLSLIHI